LMKENIFFKIQFPYIIQLIPTQFN
jgi:hypothetical protein